MGDWEDFCAANGRDINWEPWNERGWSDERKTCRLADKYLRYTILCDNVNTFVERVIRRYSSKLTILHYFDRNTALSTLIITKNFNSKRGVQYFFEFEGINTALPLHLRKILKMINDGRWSYLDATSKYNLSCKIIHASKSFEILKYDKISTSELTRLKFHCDKDSACG